MVEIEFHNPRRPDTCEVCRYLLERPEYDARREHTLSMIAQAIILDDLRDASGPLAMRSVYQETIGFPGPQHRIEPRHWLLALLESPEVRLLLG
ncbi:MAG: hypothetical protein M0R73_08600 [Dehalococcoidia bacterium]|nr:hypothetical protein [Dehalococcoidia bacterium]